MRGMAGEVWIEKSQERLTRLNAQLVADVDFGWGFIGHLDKGGTIYLEQTEMSPHDWELTRMKLNLTGRAFLVKTLNIRMTEEMAHYSPVPTDLDYHKAIRDARVPVASPSQIENRPASLALPSLLLLPALYSLFPAFYSHIEAIRRSHAAVPKPGILHGSPLVAEVDIGQPVTLAVSVGPLEVVEHAPRMKRAYPRSILNRTRQLSQLCPEKSRSVDHPARRHSPSHTAHPDSCIRFL